MCVLCIFLTNLSTISNQVSKNMSLNDIEKDIRLEYIPDTNPRRKKISPSILILMVLHFKMTTKITDRKLLMCAVYVFRSLYLNFGHGTHTHTKFIPVVPHKAVAEVSKIGKLLYFV